MAIDNTPMLVPHLVVDGAAAALDFYAKAFGAEGARLMMTGIDAEAGALVMAEINGAGGDGGSLTLLTGALSWQKRELVRAIEAASPGFQSLPIYLSRHGLRLWEAA